MAASNEDIFRAYTESSTLKNAVDRLVSEKVDTLVSEKIEEMKLSGALKGMEEQELRSERDVKLFLSLSLTCRDCFRCSFSANIGRQASAFPQVLQISRARIISELSVRRIHDFVLRIEDWG